MAYAEKRDGKLTGRWMGRVRLKGKEFQHAFDNKKSAESYEKWVQLTGEEPPTVSQSGSGRTFKEVAAACRAAGGAQGKWKYGRDPSVIKRLEYVVGFLGAYDITAVDQGVLEKLVEHLARRKIAGRLITGATINRYMHAVSSVLSYALSRGWITNKPKTPKQRDSNARKLTVGVGVEQTLVNYMRGQGWTAEALAIEWLIATGLRVGELYKLTPEQIGNGQVQLYGDQTKNDSPRLVYVDDTLCRSMRALIASNNLPNAFHLRRKFKKAAEACGQPKSLVLHSLRHTTATRLLHVGTDLQVTQEIMGHKDIRTTLRYRHVADEMKLEAAKKLTEMRGQQPPDSTVVSFNTVKKTA